MSMCIKAHLIVYWHVFRLGDGPVCQITKRSFTLSTQYRGTCLCTCFFINTMYFHTYKTCSCIMNGCWQWRKVETVPWSFYKTQLYHVSPPAQYMNTNVVHKSCYMYYLVLQKSSCTSMLIILTFWHTDIVQSIPNQLWLKGRAVEPVTIATRKRDYKI